MTSKHKYILFSVILVLGFFLRFYHIFWYVGKKVPGIGYFQDESFTVGKVVAMDPKRHNFNPHYFINPGFYYYSIFSEVEFLSKFSHKYIYFPLIVGNKTHYDVKRTADELLMILKIARITSALFGFFSILFLFLAVKNLYNINTALLSAAFFSVIYPGIFFSHIAVVESTGLFWNILLLYIISIDFHSSKKWLYIFFVFFGVAVGTKYFNVFLIVPFLVKLIYEKRYKDIKPINWFVAISLMLIAFFVFNPYALISPKEFLFGDKTGFGGMFGKAGLTGYNNYPSSILGPFIHTFKIMGIFLFLSFIAGIFFISKRRSTSDKIIISYISIFYATLIYHSSPHIRHLLPLTPYICLVSSLIFMYLAKLRKYLILLPVLMIGWYGIYSTELNIYLNYEDPRDAMSRWILKNIRVKSSFGFPKLAPTQPIGFYVNRSDLYTIYDLNYSCKKLDRYDVNFVLFSKDILDIRYGYPLKKRADKRYFLDCLNKRYVFIKGFFINIPLRLKFPKEIRYLVHPETYLYHRKNN